jgi:hypothetical protein
MPRHLLVVVVELHGGLPRFVFDRLLRTPFARPVTARYLAA